VRGPGCRWKHVLPAGLRGRVRGLRPRGAEARGDVSVAGPVREVMSEQARTSGLIIAAAALLVFPAWSGFDVILEPDLAPTFLVVRLAGLAPIALAAWLLWRHPVGRRRPELLTVAILVVVQAAVVWMVPQVDAVEAYVLGLSIALYGSGCLLAGHPRWTGSLVMATWLALGVAVLAAPAPMEVRDVAVAGFYLATATLVALVAHVRRYRLAVQELEVRMRLEREQHRTRVLLTKLERLSQEDPLTGLANRRRWDAELATACAEARRSGVPVAVVLLDLDHFKQVNDRHGHAGGDGALTHIAGLLAGRVRGGEVVARLGGDELGVLLPGTDLGRAVELAERLRREAAELRPPGFAPGELTLSLGVAAAAGDQAFPVELMSQADGQLYRAKITRNAVGAPRRDLPTGLDTAAPAPALAHP
jgi:diguanylate cyclase (GGDEF)-like protein